MKVDLVDDQLPGRDDPRQGALHHRAGCGRAGPRSIHCLSAIARSPTPYYQNTPILGRLREWGEAPAGCLFRSLWHPVLVAEQIGTLAAIAQGLHHAMGWATTGSPRWRQHQDASIF
jgi:hypothetical protein